jgi:hypothetical protein
MHAPEALPIKQGAHLRIADADAQQALGHWLAFIHRYIEMT